MYIVASEPCWIDISCLNVHKGSSVKVLQDMPDVTKEETIAFGDGMSDMALFETVGTSFATKKGFQVVKHN